MSSAKNHRLVHGLGHELRNRLCSLQAGLALLDASGRLRQDILDQISHQVAEAVVWSQDFLPLLAAELLQQTPPPGASSLAEALQAAVVRTQPGRECRDQQLHLEPSLRSGCAVSLPEGLLTQALSCVLVASSLRGGRGAQLHVTLHSDDGLWLRIAVPGVDWDLSSRDRAGSVELQAVAGVVGRMNGSLEDRGSVVHLHLPTPGPTRAGRSTSGDGSTEGEAETLTTVAGAAAHP